MVDIPEEIAQAAAQAEQEATAATCSRPDVVPVYSGPMPMTTVDDLEARLRMLMAAWVVQYEDGQLRIRFDTESRRQVEMAKVQSTAALVNF